MAANDRQNSTNPVVRSTAKEEKWREILAAQEESGLRQSEYCRQNDIPVHQFAWWKRQIRRRDTGETATATRKGPEGNGDVGSSLVPIQIAGLTGRSHGGATAGTFEIVLKDGDPVIRIPQEFDEEKLSALLRVLRHSC